MSTIRENVKCKIHYRDGRDKDYKVNVETYNSADEVVRDCQKRPVRIGIYKVRNSDISKDWHGVESYDEALELLKLGYQPTVDKLQAALKANVMGEAKRIAFQNNVHGFAPVVPLALKGVPNSMVNMTMKPIKCKVIDVYYDITASCEIDPEDIIKAGQKLLGTIIELEKQGYRFNLYAIQTYTQGSTVDVLCVKVKSSDKPLDLKRISFPLTHTAFFRVIGFDWQGKSPITRDIGSGRGRALSYDITPNDKTAKEFTSQVFGDNAIYFASVKIMRTDEQHIKEVLTNAK